MKSGHHRNRASPRSRLWASTENAAWPRAGGKGIWERLIETTQPVGPATCHYVSQLRRDKVTLYMSLCSNIAGSMWESTGLCCKICSALPQVGKGTAVGKGYRSQAWG